MAEKLLLHISYECFRNKIHMPWDAIAHRLHPGSTGAAVAQHFNKVRQDLIAEGHVVPPVANKPGNGSSLDPEIRGYVRMHPDGPDRDTTRPVKFSEHLPDAKFNLPDSFGFEDDEEENEDVMNVDGSVDFTDEESEVPDTPTPVRQPIRNAETAQKFHAELYDEAEDHMNGLPGDNLRHGNFHSNKAAMDGNVSRRAWNWRQPADSLQDIHPDFRAWAPFGEGYQMGFAAGGHDQLREHDGWTHSPYASSHGSQQLRGMSAPMFGYGRPGGYMGMPMRMTPGFLPYASNLDGYSIAPQRPSSPAGVGKPVDSPRGETKLETPPSDGAEPAEAPFDDLIVRISPSLALSPNSHSLAARRWRGRRDPRHCHLLLNG